MTDEDEFFLLEKIADALDVRQLGFKAQEFVQYAQILDEVLRLKSVYRSG